MKVRIGALMLALMLVISGCSSPTAIIDGIRQDPAASAPLERHVEDDARQQSPQSATETIAALESIPSDDSKDDEQERQRAVLQSAADASREAESLREASWAAASLEIESREEANREASRIEAGLTWSKDGT